MKTEQPILSLKDVSFEYPSGEEGVEGNLALNGLSLDVNKGEFVGVIGHNGSGKSTMSKLLNAIILPTRGDVLVKGLNTKDEKATWDIRQTAGMVFQNPDNQLVATVVEEDVAFGPENLGVIPGEIRKRVDESLATVGMSAFKKKEPHNLSGGQKQRVAIAGILAMEPECIIFDEPTAMLDPSGRTEVMNTIKKLNREKSMTVLHITHYMDELTGADRIIVLDKGKIVMEGTPREVFAHVDELKRIGLDVPQMTAVAHGLREKGFDLPDDLLDVTETAEAICRLK
ncbi:MAG: energy-coupling factor transporter ATPase [Eubacteriaceae bacterium]|jgi:energy-coupling factor transport system ATP-binding protein